VRFSIKKTVLRFSNLCGYSSGKEPIISPVRKTMVASLNLFIRNFTNFENVRTPVIIQSCSENRSIFEV
jgi:hypothetical protein